MARPKKKDRVRGPFRIKGRDVYYVDVDRKRRSLGTTNKEEAEAIVKDIRKKHRPIKEPESPKISQQQASSIKSFENFKKKYLDWAEKVQPVKTFKANRLALDKLEPHCKGLNLINITSFHLDQMIAKNKDQGLKTGSINCYIRHAKTTFSQAVKWKLIDEHPFKECRQLRMTKTPPKALEDEGVKQLLQAIDDCYDCLLIKAYLVTGRSRAELVRLRWEHVNFKTRKYYVTRTKTYLSKWYPMGGEFETLLLSMGQSEGSEHVFWRRYHPDTITHKVKEYMVKAGLNDNHLHHLRHSFARMYLDTGGSIYALQQLLGHTQVQTTQIYSSLSDTKLGKEIDKIKL